MKQLIKFGLYTFIAASLVISCNNDEGNTTTENPDPGNADSLSNGQTNNNNVANADADFLSFVAYSGMKEIEEGRVAQQIGQSADIRNLGKMMVEEHTAMGEKVKALAASKNVQLPTGLKTEDMDDIRREKAGKDFDREYASDMVDDHEEAIRRFENSAANATDPEVKALASEALPKLKNHLEMAKAAKAKVKG